MNLNQILIPYYQAVEELKIKFKGLRKEYTALDQYSPIEFVTGRVKKIASIIDKAKRKNIPFDKIEEQIEDIAGIRIMCQFEEDIKTVIEIIRSRHKKDLTVVEERDYINNTKPSGYRSYHIIVKYPLQTTTGEKEILAEIQIRTLAMNFWATIEHSLKYKYKQNMPAELQQRLIKTAMIAYTLDEEMAKIREEVLKSQEGFREESHIVSDIFDNIQKLAKQQNDMTDVYERFWHLWEENEIEILR
ncbi:MAG: GTP pyrophosphokinase, partial [Epulopiscium sp. Nuni2H_MBin003]